MNFGEYVKKLRTEMRLSQRELSKKSGINTATISRIESGERKTTTPRVIKAIAPYLGISYEELMMQAGYIDIDVVEDKLDLFDEDNRAFFDVYRRAKRIAERDEELISILDRVASKFSQEDLESMKKILNCILDGRLPRSEKRVLLTIFEKFTSS